MRVALYHRQRAALDALLEAEPPLEDPDVAAVGDVHELRRRLARDAELVARRARPTASRRCTSPPSSAASTPWTRCWTPAPTRTSWRTTRRACVRSTRPRRRATCASAERLLAGGADPDAQQQGGFTALHAAAQHDDEELAAVLLRHGADPAIRDGRRRGRRRHGRGARTRPR